MKRRTFMRLTDGKREKSASEDKRLKPRRSGGYLHSYSSSDIWEARKKRFPPGTTVQHITTKEVGVILSFPLRDMDDFPNTSDAKILLSGDEGRVVQDNLIAWEVVEKS